MKNAAVEQTKPVTPPVKATKQDFIDALDKKFKDATRVGRLFLDVKASALHMAVGGYPGRGHAMPTCCTVMNEAMLPGDETLITPPRGNGATLQIRYKLPR